MPEHHHYARYQLDAAGEISSAEDWTREEEKPPSSLRAQSDLDGQQLNLAALVGEKRSDAGVTPVPESITVEGADGTTVRWELGGESD